MHRSGRRHRRGPLDLMVRPAATAEADTAPSPGGLPGSSASPAAEASEASSLAVSAGSATSGQRAPGPRLGIVVPRHRHDAVTRNRLKRRLREIGRRDVLPALRACGSSSRLLVRARPEAYKATHAELRETLVRFTEELCSGALSSD
jgi:ribonuclease P protein component